MAVVAAPASCGAACDAAAAAAAAFPGPALLIPYRYCGIRERLYRFTDLPCLSDTMPCTVASGKGSVG